MTRDAGRIAGFVVAAAVLLAVAGWAMQRKSAPPDPAVPATASAPASSSAAQPDRELTEEELAGRKDFGDAMSAAAKRTVPGMTTRFVAERFTVEWEKGATRGEYFLDRSYREYLQLPEADRAAYVDKRAAMIGGPQLPVTYAEAEPHVVPLVRERISHEVARIIASTDPLRSLPPEPPHVVLTEHLWGVLAYETPEQFVRLDGAALKAWSVTFETAWPAAVQRLAARSTPAKVQKTHGLREITFGDGNESARLLVPSVLAGLELKGDPVVVSPKEDLLLVAGADDALALDDLADRLVKEWDRGSQNMRVVRVKSGKVEPYVPAESSPTRARFDDLRRSADQRDERLQREQLRRRLDEKEDAPFVASLIRTKDHENDEELAFVVHTEDTPSLLPRGDWVVFRRVDLTKKTATTLACGSWDKVYALMKDRWKEAPLWPPRWLATKLPTAAELAKLGCDHPVLARDLNVARAAQ